MNTIFAVMGSMFPVIIRHSSAVTLSSILSDLGDIFTAIFGWVPTIFTTITANPLLFLLIAGAFSLIAIGVVRRLLRLR